MTVDDIRRLAYLLWEAAGKPAGRDDEFWLAAERILKEQQITDHVWVTEP